MRIDTSKIEGYAEMTAEQKLQALESFEYDDGAAEVKRYKDAVSKANSEASDWKKKHNALLSEEERKQQEIEATLKDLQEKNAAYEQRERISAAKAAFLANGFDEAGATAAAEAFISGDTQKFASAMKTYRSAVETQLKSSLMDETPRPEGGAQQSGMDYGKAIADADARGDLVAAAYYTRLQEQAAKQL